jgi:hypothetical protein
MALNGPTELSSRPERSVVEGPAVSLPVLTQTLTSLKYVFLPAPEFFNSSYCGETFVCSGLLCNLRNSSISRAASAAFPCLR